ncbi:MAG: cadherin-like beta sandwich domain-containing protein [Nitrospiraceae bacterium]
MKLRYWVVALFLLTWGVGGCIPSNDAPAPTNSAANLASMSVGAGALAPGFNGEVTSYEVVAPNETTTTTITAAPVDSAATLQVNNQAAVAGQPFGPVPLAVGTNPITVLASVPGATKTYTVIVTRGGAADLFDLELSAGPLTPDFDPAGTTYAVSASEATTQTTVTATLSDHRATLRINNQPAVSEQPSAPIALAAGSNVISIVVTAVNGTTKTYTVTVNRAGVGNANLSALSVTAGPLVPTFTSAGVNYAVVTAATTTTTMVTARTQDPTSSITINGSRAISGVPFGPIPLNASGTPTAINVVVSAADGVTSKTYVVTVSRGLSSDANLSGLSVSVGALRPAFSSQRTTYSVQAARTATSTTVTAITNDGAATVRINGAPAVSGVPFGPIQLVGSTTRITVEVRAQNGATKSYRIDVKR